MNSPVSVSTMAIVCCFACRSHPTIFISASFVPSLLVGYRKVYSGRREADVVMTSAIRKVLYWQTGRIFVVHPMLISVLGAGSVIEHGEVTSSPPQMQVRALP